MYLWELSTQIFRDMRQHKARSILAMFGIIWGTFTIVVLLALGEGFYLKNMKSLTGLAEGAITVIFGRTTLPYAGYPSGQILDIKAADIMTMRHALPMIRYISPEVVQPQTLSYGKQQIKSSVIGVSPDLAFLQNRHAMQGGRFINKLDIQQQRLVIFIGQEIYKKLFNETSAVGKQILLNGIPFTVVGVLRKETNNASWHSNTSFIPYTTAIKLWGDQAINDFLVMPNDIDQMTQFKKILTNYLSHKYHFDPQDKSAIYIFDPTTMLQFILWFFRSIQLFLGFCGALTLAVGGIGVANVMYLIVEERTHEIGLRMALGAQPMDILLQFLLEAGVIILMGCAIGFLLSFIMIEILQHVSLPDWLGKPQFSAIVFIFSAITLALIGLAAGYFPARRAARMTPITALAF